jgi:hypothetical protein
VTRALGGVNDRMVLEAEVEAYFNLRVKAVGGLTRKLSWIGTRRAPDRFVALNYLRDGTPGGRVILVELKRPGTLRTFPKNAHERAQSREHARLRKYGITVVVIDSKAGVDELLRVDPNYKEKEFW